MLFVFPSPVTMVKLHEKKCQSYIRVNTDNMVKYRRHQQEKMMDFDYREEYLKGVYQTKNYYGSVKKNTFSFSSDLPIDKKIYNVKEDLRRKTLTFPKRCAA